MERRGPVERLAWGVTAVKAAGGPRRLDAPPGETVGRFDVATGATSRLIADLDRGEPCQWRFRRRRPCRPRFMVGIGDAGGDVCVAPTERPSPLDVGRVA